jgi:hypothetical protein
VEDAVQTRGIAGEPFKQPGQLKNQPARLQESVGAWMEGAMVKQVVAIDSIAVRARFIWAGSRFGPENRPKRHCRHFHIRLTDRFMRGAPVKGLVLTWIRRQPG